MSAIRTAVIGFGTAGSVFHAPLIAAEPELRLAAMVTASPERARRAASEYPEAEVIAGTDELFSRASEFDLVVIGSPNVTHAPLALQAIQAGLDVVIDKPIAVTSEQAQRVADAADAAGVVLSVFQNRRWDGDFMTVRDVIARGDLGDVRQFESAFEWFQPVLGGRWKDTTVPADGGGILYDLAPHLIDQAIELFGDVVDVHAELDARRDGAVNDDEALLTLRHANGVRSRLWMSAVSPVPRPRFRVVGSLAVLTSSGLDPQEPQSIAGRRPGSPGFGVHDDGRTATLKSPEGTVPVPLLAGAYSEYYRLLVPALRRQGPAPVTAAQSIRSLAIIEAAIGGVR